MAKNAGRDGNSRPSIICASSVNGMTIVPALGDPNTHSLKCVQIMSGVDNGNNYGNAMPDENGVGVWLAESNANDGTFVEIYADPVTQNVFVEVI